MKRWLLAATTVALLGSAPAALADRDHDRGNGWHHEHDRRDDRLGVRIHKPRNHHSKSHSRDSGWHYGHHRSGWKDHGNRGRGHHRHGYRNHHDRHRHHDRYRHHDLHRDHDRHRNGLVIGIGDDRQGVVIWNR